MIKSNSPVPAKDETLRRRELTSLGRLHVYGLAVAVALTFGALSAVRMEIALVICALAAPIVLVITGRAWIVILLLLAYVPVEEVIEKFLPDSFRLVVRFGWEPLLWGLLGVVVVARRISGQPIRVGVAGIPFALYVISAALSATLNDVPLAAFVLGVRPLLRYVAVLFLLLNLDVPRAFIRRSVLVILSVAAVVSFIGLMQAAVGPAASEWLRPAELRVGGELIHPEERQPIGQRLPIFSTLARYDSLGTYLVAVMLLIVGVLLAGEKKLIRPKWRLLLLFAVTLTLTLSRQAWLGLAVGAIVAVIVARRGRWLFWCTYPAAAAVLTIALLPELARYSGTVQDVSLPERVFELFSPRYWQVSGSSGRLFVLTEVGRMLLYTVPFFGFGPGRFGSLSASFLGEDKAVTVLHIPPEISIYVNDVNWITMLGQFGLFGVAAFALVLLRLFLQAVRLGRHHPERAARAIGLAAAAAVPAACLLGFMGPNFETRGFSLSLWLLLGLSASLAIGDFEVSSKTRNPGGLRMRERPGGK